MEDYDLSNYGITVPNTFRNLNPAKLYEEAIRHEPKTTISSAGAFIAYSGAKTGRSPKDKRIVKHPTSEKEIWWGPVNFPIGEHYFQINRERAKDYRLRRTGLRHLQCGIFPCKSPDRGHDLFNIDRSLVRKPGNGDSRYGICRRDEKRGLYHHELRS